MRRGENMRRTASGQISRPISGDTVWRSSAPMTGMAGGDDNWRPLARPLLIPAWVVIGVFSLLPVLLMAVYSFLTKEFRGGVEWDFTLAAYDQFFVTRGLFGDEPAQIEWTYLTIFWRSISSGLAGR